MTCVPLSLRSLTVSENFYQIIQFYLGCLHFLGNKIYSTCRYSTKYSTLIKIQSFTEDV